MAVDIAKNDPLHAAIVNVKDNSQINPTLSSSQYQRFNINMDSLLSDNGGVNLFHAFLNSQFSCGHFLEFLFACRGFHSTFNHENPDKPFQLARLIYRTYIKPGTHSSVPIPAHVKHDVTHRMSACYESYKNPSASAPSPEFDFTIFDSALDCVKHMLAVIYYPKFIEHLKCRPVPNATISNLSEHDVADPQDESFTPEVVGMNPFPSVTNNVWTRPLKRKNFRRSECNVQKDQRSLTSDISSRCSPLFSPLPEFHREMSLSHPAGGHPTVGTPNIATEAGVGLGDGSCCCCCGCLDDCPRCEDGVLAMVETGQRFPPGESSSDLGKNCSTVTSNTGLSQSNCFPTREEDTCGAMQLSECSKRQTSSSPDRNVLLRPGKLGLTLDTGTAVNQHEDTKCGEKGLQQLVSAGTDFEKPISTVHGDVVTRPNLAQTDPALFVLLLTKRLEKVKEVHEKMEKLKLWVNQVDEKNHISSSLTGQDENFCKDGAPGTTKDQLLPDHEVVRTQDQVSRRAEVVPSKQTPWTQNVKLLGGKVTGAVDGTGNPPMTSEDDAQGILDDHCSRIWADEKEAFKGHRRISQSTSRRSRTAWSSMHDSVREGLSGHHRALVPISLSQQRNPQPSDTGYFTTSRRNSSRARAVSSVGASSGYCTNTQAGPYCNRVYASRANTRTDTRSTTSWDSGVVPEATCSNRAYYQHQQCGQKQQHSSHDYQSSYPPPMYQDQKPDLDSSIDDDGELDAVFPHLEEEDRADLDAASLQALSSSTTELAIVNSEVTAKLVQHMTRQYNKSVGPRAHSSQGHTVSAHNFGGAYSHGWSPNPFFRARRDLRAKEMPLSQPSTDIDAVTPSCHFHYTPTPTGQYLSDQHTSIVPDYQQDWEYTGAQNSQYPSHGGHAVSSQYGRSARTRVFPTPSDTSSTFDSGISSTYDQLSLGEQDNRSRRICQWPPDRRNLSVTVVTKYSRTPSLPRRPGQAYSGSYQWQQLPTGRSNLVVGPLHHHHHHHSNNNPCSHHNHPGSDSPSRGGTVAQATSSATAAAAASSSSCTHCHPHCHHLHHHQQQQQLQHQHHLYHRHHLHHHPPSLCQSVSNNSNDTLSGSYSHRSAYSANPDGVGSGGQLLQHWLAYQQQANEADPPCYDATRGKRGAGDLPPGDSATSAAAALPHASGNLRKSFSGLAGQHRRSLATTGHHRHRQRAGGDECLSEVSACEDGPGGALAHTGGSACSSAAAGGIIVGYYLCDDPVPYRTVWTGPNTCLGANPSDAGSQGSRAGAGEPTSTSTPAKTMDPDTGNSQSGAVPAPSLTLGQFKQLIAKKGSYRYFFKKPSNEFGTGVVHEELTHDDTFLPLWDGKVVARVERVD